MELHLRWYVPTDAEALVELFTTTVQRVTRQDYTQQQRDAWAPRAYDLQHWQERFAHTQPLVAEQDRQIVGFTELENNGHVDAFYVHAHYQRRGIGSELLQALEQQARAIGIARLYAEVSITAVPFFQQHGFGSIAQQSVSVRGVSMTNYRMEKQVTRSPT